MALLNGRAGRLKSQNGDFRPGQCVRLYWRNSVTERKNKQESRFVSAEGWCTHLRDIFCPSRERKLQLDVINFMSDRCYDIQHHVMPKDPQVIAAQRGKTNTNVSVYHQMRIALNESYLLDQVLPPLACMAIDEDVGPSLAIWANPVRFSLQGVPLERVIEIPNC